MLYLVTQYLIEVKKAIKDAQRRKWSAMKIREKNYENARYRSSSGLGRKVKVRTACDRPTLVTQIGYFFILEPVLQDSIFLTAKRARRSLCYEGKIVSLRVHYALLSLFLCVALKPRILPFQPVVSM